MKLRNVCKFGWHTVKPDDMRIWMRLFDHHWQLSRA